ncbi:MAG: Ig-like domain-containing protein [Armatimonadota bacterium]
MLPGKYDVIIDMDNDGKYTLGTDYIDAGFTVRGRQVNAGFIVTGTFPPIRLALSAIPPAINANERAIILAQVQTDAGQFVSGATVNFSISGQGSLSADSATTDQNGIATVQLTATRPNQNITVRSTVTHAGQSAQAEVTVRVRAPGELGLTIRQR